MIERADFRSPRPDFTAPPVVEVALSVGFAPLAGYTNAHSGRSSRLPKSRIWVMSSPGSVTSRTTDEIVPFDEDLVSVALVRDVETRSAALAGWVRELHEICGEAATRNWDGEGAAPVQQGARSYAAKFVADLTQDVPFPEVSVDPDGEISLVWQAGSDVFSVSIGGRGRLSYAGLLGASDCHGAEWMAEQVPAEVAHQLDRLLFSPRASSRSG